MGKAGWDIGSVTAAAVLWGTTGTAAALAGTGLSPFAAGSGSFAIGGLALVALRVRELPALWGDRGARGRILIGGSSLAVFTLSFYLSMAWCGVGIGTVLTIGSSPVFVAALSAAVRRRPPRLLWSAAALLAIAGCSVMVLARSSALGSHLWWGVAAGIVAGAGYGCYTWIAGGLISPAHGPGHPQTVVVAALLGCAAAPLWIVFALTFRPVTMGDWTALLYLALIPTALGHTLFGRGLRSVTPSLAAVLSVIEPVVATLLSVWILQQDIAPFGWAGLALVVLGLVICARVPAFER